MDCFKSRPQLANVCSRNETKTADEAGAKIRNDVAVKILKQHHIKLLGPHHELHARIVDDLVFRFYLGVIPGHVAKTVEEKPIRQFHDVGFVNRRDLFSSFSTRILKRKSGDACRSLLGDDLDAIDNTRYDDVFDSRVEIFGVLAHDNQVEFRIAAGNIRQCTYGTQVGVKIERLAQPHVNGSESFS